MSGRRPKPRPIVPPPPDGFQPTVMSPFSPVGPSPSQSFGMTATFSAKSSATITGRTLEEDLSRLEIDELFKRYTISEIRGVQTRLRADAEAKQEELRLMVGERYRDLLQASSSIITMSDSANHVVRTLDQMKVACKVNSDANRTHQQPQQGKDDAQLRTLRSLSAHMKLLLDTPEHIWRLLERKKYLDATWLFLLARVVYRTLVGEDADDWESEGIDVLRQFPLVQRQWDSVSQFRSQISHKATLSLRDPAAAVDEIMHTLLSLVLLDSLPFTESLSLFLLQRTKTLQTLLAHQHSPPKSPKTSRRKSLSTSTVEEVAFSKPLRRIVVKEVKESLTKVLLLVEETMSSVRLIFGGRMDNLITEMQADSSSASLPITTSQLLSTLPSAPLLLPYLPQSIQSYSPYIDTSLQLPAAALATRTTAWFDGAVESLQARLDVWLSGLNTAAEVEQMRKGLWDRETGVYEGARLDGAELRKVLGVIDQACRKRAIAIWKQALDNLHALLFSSLASALNRIHDDTESTSDSSPLAHLFSTNLPYPPAQASSLNLASSFRQFKAALQSRVGIRTPILDEVLQAVEDRSKLLQADLEVFRGSDSAVLSVTLMEEYSPIVEECCANVGNSLNALLLSNQHTAQDGEKTHTGATIFLGRIAHELASSSRFIGNIGCDGRLAEDFRASLNKVHDLALEAWRSAAIETALNRCRERYTSLTDRPLGDHLLLSQPSPDLSAALLSLISAIQQLGLSRIYLDRHPITERAVTSFAVKLGAMFEEIPMTWNRDCLQAFWDLTFLAKVVELLVQRRRREGAKHEGSGEKGDDYEANALAFEEHLANLREELTSNAPVGTELQLPEKASESINRQLLRRQVMLGPLLGFGTIGTPGEGPVQAAPDEKPTSPSAEKTTSEKPSTLLLLGTPVADQEFQAAMELAKPSARFGLLLVGSAGTVGVR